MTQFGGDVTTAPDIQASETAKAGVVTQTASTPVDRRGLGGAFEAAAGLFAGRKESMQEKALVDFTRQQLRVADAYDQGQIRSAAEAKARMRSNLLAAIDSDPDNHEFALALIDAQNKILGIEGGAKIISDRTDEENSLNARREALVSSGMISPDATDSQVEVASSAFEAQAAAKQKYDAQMRTIDMAKANLELTGAQKKQLEAEANKAANTLFQDSLPGELTGMRAAFDRVISSPDSAANKVQMIESMFTDFLAQSAAPAADLTEQERKLYQEPFNRVRDLYLELAKGTMTLDEVKNKNTLIQEQMRSILLSDPNVAKWATASEMFNFGAFDIIIQQEVLSDVLRIIGGNTKANTESGEENPPGVGGGNNPFDGQSSTARAYREIVRIATAGSKSGEVTLTEDSIMQLDSVLGNMADSEASVRQGAKNAINFAQVLASPSFGEFVRDNGSQLQNLDEATRIMEEHYADEVWGMVQREFNNAGIVDMEAARATGGEGDVADVTTPLPDLVTFRTTGAGMEFVAVDPQNGGAVAKARQLNAELKPIINTTVQALGNLQGNMNYGSVWDSIATGVLAQPNQGEAGGDAGDDLSLENFNQAESPLDQAMTNGGFVGDGDFSNAETPAEVAASFIGFHEGEETEVLSSFIREATGNVINPATTAWCAAFVNAALGAKGQQGTDSNLARSFQNWGKAVSTPKKGDIAVFERGNSSWQGHVGFFVGPSDREGFVRILGGNQDNTVSIKEFPESKLLGYRRG